MEKTNAVGFLQNPWSPFYAGGRWPRESWLRALALSRSGQRLKLLECGEVNIYYENACPIVCENPKDVMPADTNHMRQVLSEQKPDVIICFGGPAAAAMNSLLHEFKQPLMLLPHPAYRFVTNELFNKALEILKKGFDGTVKLMPVKNGGIDIAFKQASQLSVNLSQ